MHSTPPAAVALLHFIIQQTRKADSEETDIPCAYQRLFLDQRAPLGSRYACRVIESTPDRPVQVELIGRLPIAHLRQESFASETHARTGPFARIREADEVGREDTTTKQEAPNELRGYLYATSAAYQPGQELNV